MTLTHRFLRLFLSAALALATSLNWAHAQSFTSSSKQATLVELYTSEGCSSCPPADKWLSQLTKHPDLWNEIVPIAFHVDYWDWIGWKDDFAKPEFGERQKRYKVLGNTRSVYTPGFFVNGKEWRGFFKKRSSIPAPTSQETGTIVAQLENKRLSVTFTPTHATQSKLKAHAVILRFGKSHFIKWGENIGKTLSHDFIAGAISSENTTIINGSHQAQLDLELPKPNKDEKYGVAIWITSSDNKQVLQATGGWLAD